MKNENNTVNNEIIVEEVKPKRKRRTKKVEESQTELVVEAIAVEPEPVVEVTPEPVKPVAPVKKLSVNNLIAALIVITFFFQQIEMSFIMMRVNEVSWTLSTMSPIVLRNIDLKDMSYYNENKLETVESGAEFWNLQEDEYFVYFHREDCSYCKTTEKNDLMPFIRNGHTQNIKIYFYEMSDTDMLYANESQYNAGVIKNPTPDNFYIMGTPTLLHIKDGVATTYVGTNEIPLALTSYMK